MRAAVTGSRNDQPLNFQKAERPRCIEAESSFHFLIPYARSGIGRLWTAYSKNASQKIWPPFSRLTEGSYVVGSFVDCPFGPTGGSGAADRLNTILDRPQNPHSGG